ncbi:MAG: peptide chain release factor 1 [Deltaproteobacteria bacterium]|jgi:peptide chain release factor 1|nr:peptide chain release factor 1 [Deltaproteobacteria bacterium]
MTPISFDNSELTELESRYDSLERDLQSPDLLRDQRAYAATAKRFVELGRILEVWRKLTKIEKEIEDTKSLLADPSDEIREMAQSELEELGQSLTITSQELKTLLLPKDPNDFKNTIVEIRAGTGGDEAALFAYDLYRMYCRYAEAKGWHYELLSSNSFSGIGTGFKEVIFLVEGDGAYSHLKYESGVHRVQRVPATETQGRVHTSAVTVAVLPEAEEVEIDFRPEEIRVDVYRSSGPGGQSVNTTDSAVRVTHLPSGMVVSIQDEKSQHKNKAKALKILRARLLDKANLEQKQKISEERREQVGTGDRSERIRTYNFAQGRVTDHRIGLTLYRLQEILDGDLTELISQIGAHFQAKLLAEATLSHA